MYKSLCFITEKLNDFSFENLHYKRQNEEYEGTTFSINTHTFRSRLAKSTPKKKGYFVAFWEKDITDKNQPFLYENSPDKLIITILDGQLSGQFIFPKEVLLKKGILKSKTSNGKIAMRIYPTWVHDLNKTAARTQEWQMNHFIDTSITVDKKMFNSLYFE